MDIGKFLVNVAHPELATSDGVFTVADAAMRLVASGFNNVESPTQALVEVFVGQNDTDGVWSPLKYTDTQVQLNKDKTFVILPFSGRYRVVYSGGEDVKVWSDSNSLLLDKNINYVIPL